MKLCNNFSCISALKIQNKLSENWNNVTREAQRDKYELYCTIWE